MLSPKLVTKQDASVFSLLAYLQCTFGGLWCPVVLIINDTDISFHQHHVKQHRLATMVSLLTVIAAATSSRIRSIYLRSQQVTTQDASVTPFLALVEEEYA